MSRDILATDNLGRTSPEIAARFKRSEVRAGELVYSIRASVGAVHTVPNELDGANLTQGTARISPGNEVTPTYLVSALRSSHSQNWVERQLKGSTFREITLQRLRQHPVLIPPMVLQERFDRATSMLTLLKAQRRKATVEASTLFNALVQRAFHGEL